jgi:AcrR family transcriptional regulator
LGAGKTFGVRISDEGRGAMQSVAGDASQPSAGGLAMKRKTTNELRVGARNKAKILAAAVELFAAKGFEGTRIAAIAAAAGLPKANVYYYFKTKTAIYRTIISGLIAQWDTALAHLRADRHPADAIGDYIRAKIEFSRRHQRESKIFASEAVHGGRFLTRQDRAHMQAITLEKAAVFRQWARSGKMDAIDPMHLFILLWASTQFYADSKILAENALETSTLRASDFDKAATVITRIVLKGCGIQAPGRRSVRTDKS